MGNVRWARSGDSEMYQLYGWGCTCTYHTVKGCEPSAQVGGDVSYNLSREWTNKQSNSKRQWHHQTKPQSVRSATLGSLTNLFGVGGLWPPQTIASAYSWWGWRNHRPEAPQGSGSSCCHTHPHPLQWPPCLYRDKNSCQEVSMETMD